MRLRHRRGDLAAVAALLDGNRDHVLRVARGGEAAEPRGGLLARDLAGAGLAGDRDLRDREPLERGRRGALPLDDTGERLYHEVGVLRVDLQLGRDLELGLLDHLAVDVLELLHEVGPHELAVVGEPRVQVGHLQRRGQHVALADRHVDGVARVPHLVLGVLLVELLLPLGRGDAPVHLAGQVYAGSLSQLESLAYSQSGLPVPVPAAGRRCIRACKRRFAGLDDSVEEVEVVRGCSSRSSGTP